MRYYAITGTITMSVVLLSISEVSAVDREAQMRQLVKDVQKSKDPKAKVKAIEEVGHLGALQAKLGEIGTPALLGALSDKEPKVRSAAAQQIGRLDPPNKETVIEKLIEMLKKDTSEEVRKAAAQGLSLFGTDAKEALPTIKEMAAKEGKKGGKFFKPIIASLSGKSK